MMVRRPLLIIANILALFHPVWGEELSKGPAYLVYAGPYSTSPSSAFGHLFLVFQNDKTDPLPLWDAVSFTVETPEVGPLKYFFSGIAGGFSGIYKTLKFHRKTRDYGALEDRDLWLVQLRLSDVERANLEKAISLVEGREYPYTFFHKNCAYYIQLLLSAALPSIKKPGYLVSPIGVIQTVIDQGLSKSSYYRPALSQRLSLEANNLSLSTVARLRKTDWREIAIDRVWLSNLYAVERLFIQDYLHWKTLHWEGLLDSEVDSGISYLRFLNVRTPPQQNTVHMKPSSPGRELPLPDFHRYQRFTGLYRINEKGKKRVSLRYRPALHSLNDPWHGYRRINTLEAMTTEVSFKREQPLVRLEEFTLFSQQSRSPAGWIRRDISWLLDASIKRERHLDQPALQPEITTGIGKTYRIDYAYYASAILTFSARGPRKGSVALVPGLLLEFSALPTGSWRWGVQCKWQRYIFNPSHFHSEASIWIRGDLNERLGLTSNAKIERRKYNIGLALDWYLFTN